MDDKRIFAQRNLIFAFAKRRLWFNQETFIKLTGRFGARAISFTDFSFS